MTAQIIDFATERLKRRPSPYTLSYPADFIPLLEIPKPKAPRLEIPEVLLPSSPE